MTAEAKPCPRPWRYVGDTWAGSEPCGVSCPMCGRGTSIGYEGRMHKAPASAWLRCRWCGVWWDLGEVASCSLAEVSEEAGRRARRLFKAPAQRTLEEWA